MLYPPLHPCHKKKIKSNQQNLGPLRIKKKYQILLAIVFSNYLTLLCCIFNHPVAYYLHLSHLIFRFLATRRLLYQC